MLNAEIICNYLGLNQFAGVPMWTNVNLEIVKRSDAAKVLQKRWIVE